MRKTPILTCLIVVMAAMIPSAGFAAQLPNSSQQLTPGQTHMLGQVHVFTLPEAAGQAQGPPRQIMVHVPDPQAFGQDKRMAHEPNFVPPGNAQKHILRTNLSGPQTINPGPALAGAPGGSPNPCGCSPPDVIVDVGNGYVFEMVNLAGIIYSTSGSVVKNTFALSGFFGLPTSSMSDPFVLYDVLSGRWFASVIDIPDNQVRFAVSASSDPTGTWKLYSVSTSGYLPDQPFIGTNDDKFVVSANDFLKIGNSYFFVGGQYWAVSKQELVNGASTVDLATNGADSTLFSLHPARHLGSSSGFFYLVTVGSGSTSTGGLVILSGTPPGTVSNTRYSYGINSLSNPPDAQQPGTSTLLATNDDRVLSAAWLSNTLWFTANDACLIVGDSATRSCLRLIQLTTSGISAPTKGNDLDYALSGNYYFYPAVSLDNLGNIAVVYGRSSSAVYPSAYVTAIQSNAFQTPALIASGTAPDTSTRYGDYFGAGTDFSTSTFWVGGEYRVDSTFQNWSTAVAPVTLSSTTASFDFSLSNSGGITVTQAGSGMNTITATLVSGTTQSVSLSCSGLPTGASCSFGTNPVTPTGSSTLTVSTTGSTPTGSSAITVTGTVGTLSHTTSFTLTVNAPPPPFDFSLTNSGGITVSQGASGQNTITTTLVSGSTQSVSLSCSSGLPTGASCGFSPANGNPTFSSTLTITTSSSTPTGSSTIAVVGTGGGLTRSTSFTLTVNPATIPSLSVSVSTNKGSYSKGSTVTITVTVTSSGSAVSGASISLTIVNPSGTSVSTQSGTTGSSGTATFTWTIPLAAGSGTYTVKATASATGYTSGSGSTTFRVR